MYVICASIISCAPGTTARTSLIAASSSMLGGPALPDVADEYLTAFKCYALIVLQRLELRKLVEVEKCHDKFLSATRNSLDTIYRLP